MADSTPQRSYEELRELAAQHKHRVPTTGEGEAISPLPGFGTFYVPQEQTLQHHFMLVYYRDNNLGFWPQDYPSFDGIVSQMFTRPYVINTEHPDYLKWEGLRDNMATVRNYLMHHVLKDVDLSNHDELRMAQLDLVEMGREVGAALQRDSFWRRPFTLHLDKETCNEPGEGAAKIYELLTKQQQPSFFMRPIHWLMGRRYWEWKLPPIEETPFAPQHVADFSVERGISGSYLGVAPEQNPLLGLGQEEAQETAQQQAQAAQVDPMAETSVTPEAIQNNTGIQLSLLGAAIAGNAMSLERVEQLPEPVKDEAIAIARDILEKLKARDGSQPLPQWLERPAEQLLNDTQALAEATSVYAQDVRTLLQSNPEMADEPAIQEANQAVGQLAYQIKKQALEQLQADGLAQDAQAAQLELDNMPAEWKTEPQGGIAGLANKLAAGLNVTRSRILSREHSQPAPEMEAMLQHAMTPEERQAMQAMGETGVGEKAPDMGRAKTAQTNARSQQQQKQVRHETHREAVEASASAPVREGHSLNR